MSLSLQMIQTAEHKDCILTHWMNWNNTLQGKASNSNDPKQENTQKHKTCKRKK
jgi:hypothetical protein